MMCSWEELEKMTEDELERMKTYVDHYLKRRKEINKRQRRDS